MFERFNFNQIKLLFHYSQPSWKCSGTKNNPHPKIRNYKDKCELCDLTFGDLNPDHQIQTRRKIIIMSFVVTFLSVGISISASIYIRQKLLEAEQLNTQLQETKVLLKKAQRELRKVPKLENQLKIAQNNLKLTTDELNTTKTQLQNTGEKLTETETRLEQNKEQLEKTTNKFSEASQCVELMGKINNVLLIGVNLPKHEVTWIQERLHNSGVYQERIDGKFGYSTVKAVKEFQQSCDLKI